MKFTQRTYRKALKRAGKRFQLEFSPERRFDLHRAERAAIFIGKIYKRARREGKRL